MAKVNIKSEKITPIGGIYYASKAFYALSFPMKTWNTSLRQASSNVKKSRKGVADHAGRATPFLKVLSLTSCPYAHSQLS